MNKLKPNSSSLEENFITQHQWALLNHGENYLFTTNADLQLVLLNDRAKALLHFLQPEGKEDVNLHEVLELQSASARQVWLEKIQEVRDHKQNVGFSFQHFEEGRFVSINAEIKPLLKGGTLHGFSFSFEDDTERQLLNRLTELKSKFKSAALTIQNEKELLWAVNDEILSQLYLEDAIIFMLKQDVLHIATAHGSKRTGNRLVAEDLEIPLGQGLTGTAAQTGKALMVNDVSKDKRYFSRHFQGQSEIAVPIKQGRQVIGVINCESRFRNFFEEVHLQMLQEVADIVATRLAQIKDRQNRERLEERHQAILGSTHNGYMLLDLNLNLVSYNAALAKRFGDRLSINLVEGRPAKEFIPSQFKEDFNHYCQQVLAENRIIRSQAQFKFEGSQITYLRLTYSPALNNARKIFGVTVIIEDISSLKRHEQAIIEKNKRLNKSNKELDKFVYSVSHDLRAPLSSIMGINRLMAISESWEEQREYTALLGEAAESMDDFIRQILHYSRNSRSEIERINVNLEKEVDKALQKIRFMAGFDQITIYKNLASPSVLSDSYRLGIILNNLLSNAVKYHNLAQDKPYIAIESQALADGSVELTVSDNGKGIEKQYLPKLFEMFYRATGDKPGSGLGLYIMKDSLEALGGTCTVQSAVGQGTTFTLIFPQHNKQNENDSITN